MLVTCNDGKEVEQWIGQPEHIREDLEKHLNLTASESYRDEVLAQLDLAMKGEITAPVRQRTFVVMNGSLRETWTVE